MLDEGDEDVGSEDGLDEDGRIDGDEDVGSEDGLDEDGDIEGPAGPSKSRWE